MRTSPLRILVSCGLVLVATACSSDGGPQGEAGTATVASVPVVDTAADPIVSTAGTMGDSMGGTAADGFCGLVTTDDLAVLLPDETPGELDSGISPGGNPICTWAVGDGQVQWSVEDDSFTQLRSATSGAEPLDGLGTQAFVDAATDTVVVETDDGTVYAVRLTPGTGTTGAADAVRATLVDIATRLVTAGVALPG